MNSDLEDFHDNCIDLLKGPGKDDQKTFSEERNEVMKVFSFNLLLFCL
jgi:hypothetical protein